MYGACARVFGLLLMGAAASTPPHLVSIHPHDPPSRLSGRAADRLSDEMMTLLWEVIPKWKVSGKDCAPFSRPPLHFSFRVAASCVDRDWFASDGAREAPIDFPVFYQKKKKKILIYSYTGAWMRLIPPVSKSGMVGKGVILPTPINKINDPQYHFRNKSISSATKWILIRYNETWVWLELFQEACCTRHCQRVAARLVISQLGQDKPHTVNIPDGEHPHVSSILLANVRLYYLIQFLMISRTDRWIDSVLVLKNGSRCHMVAV